MQLYKLLLIALYFSSGILYPVKAQKQFLIDNASYLSKEKQQEVEVFLKKENSKNEYQVFLLIAEEEQIGQQTREYVRNWYGIQDSTLAVVFLVKVFQNEDIDISLHFPDGQIKFLSKANIDGITEFDVTKKRIREKVYINEALDHSLGIIKLHYNSHQDNFNLKYTAYLLLLTLVFYIPWRYITKKQKKNSKYQDKFIHLKVLFFTNADTFLAIGTVVIIVLLSFIFSTSLLVLHIAIGFMISHMAIYYLSLIKMLLEASTHTASKSFNSTPINSCDELNLAEAKFLLDTTTDGSLLMKNLLYDWGRLEFIELFKVDLVLHVKKGRKGSDSNGMSLPHFNSDISMEKFIDELYLMGKNSNIGFKKYVIANSLLKKGLLTPKDWTFSIWTLTEKGERVSLELREKAQKSKVKSKIPSNVLSLLKKKQDIPTLLTEGYQNKIIGAMKLSTKAKKKPITYRAYSNEEFPSNFFMDMAYAPFEEMSSEDGKSYLDYYNSNSGDFNYDTLPDTSSQSDGGYDSSGYNGGSSDHGGYSGGFDSGSSSDGGGDGGGE